MHASHRLATGMLSYVSAAALVLVATAVPALAQQPGIDPERLAELQRREVGLQVGVWLPGNLPEIEGAEYSTWPLITGFLRRGLDRHLAWENTVSFWMRRQEHERRDPLGVPVVERVSTYLLPFLTSLTFYPATGPEDRVEPFLRGGAGVVLAIDDRRGTEGGLLGTGREGTIMFTGLGARGVAGLDLRLSPRFGLTAAAQYQWIHFLDGEPGGLGTYHGPAVEAGLVYRFHFPGS